MDDQQLPPQKPRKSRSARRRRRFQRKRRQNANSDKSPTPEPPSPIATLEAIIDPESGIDGEGEDCELQVYEDRYDTKGEKQTLRVGTKTEFEPSKGADYRAGLILTRTYSPDKTLRSTHLKIKSRHIKKAMRDVIKQYPQVTLQTSGHIYIFTPPMCLFHYRQELADYANGLGNSAAKDHIKLCLDYVKTALRREIQAFETTMILNETPSIEHRHLWMAFKPGDLIYERKDNVEVVSRLFDIASIEDDFTGEIDCWRLYIERVGFDGEEFGFVCGHIAIHKYDGCKPLKELKAFPLQHHPEQTRVREELIARGRKFVSLCGTQYRFYDGVAKFYDDNAVKDTVNFQVQHRIMIDTEEFHTNSYYDDVEFRDTKTFNTATGEHLNMSDDELLMCYHEVPGFSLVWRRWALCDVANIQEIHFNTDAFKQLVFSEDKKALIRSLVEQSEGKDSEFDDIIKGKGKGLIFLLHGPPGVGKTLTAESIADHTKRPLFSISSGQLIGPASEVETKLSKLLSLAKRWEAVVLVDEADVFLQERSITELDRNSLVSILLRVLEYFEGTMFLTTNRAETIDSAFRSRIHLSLAYPPLSREALKTLWENTIIRACSGSHPSWLSSECLDTLASAKVNGRDIKNIVRMAYAMARNGHREIKHEDIRQSLDAFETFDVDMSQTPVVQNTQQGPNGFCKPEHSLGV